MIYWKNIITLNPSFYVIVQTSFWPQKVKKNKKLWEKDPYTFLNRFPMFLAGTDKLFFL